MTTHRLARPFPLALALLVVGCGDPPTVARYEVPKPDTVFDGNHVEEHARKESKVGKPSRLIAAMMSRPDATYFFRLQDDPEAVGRVADEVRAFIESVEFSKPGPPTWELPETWSEEPGSGQFRFATISVGEDELELAATSLNAGQERLPNVNRWLGDVSIAALADEDDLTKENGVEVIEKPWGELIIVDVIGTKKAGGMRPPFAGMGGSGGRPRTPSPSRPTPPKETIAYDTPEGWTEQESSGEKSTVIAVERDGDEGTIAIRRFASGDPAVAKVALGIWYADVGLPSPDRDASLDDLTTEVAAKGMTGRFVDLAAEGDEPARKALLGALFATDASTWTVKFTGPKRLLDGERERFDAFVASLEVRTEETHDGE